MHLVILTHYYPPEFGGVATRMYELADHMIHSGHQVTVITTHPRHHMRTGSDTASSHSDEQTTDGIRVIRVPAPDWRRGALPLRALQDLLAEIGFLYSGLRCRRADAVFVESPPITLPIIAYGLKLFRGSSLVLNVQDVFPELLLAMGIIERGSFLARIGQGLERLAYRCADYIGVHSPKNRLHVLSRSVPEEIVNVFPLWVDTELIRPRPRNNAWAREHGLTDKFVVMYSGTVGFAMGATTIPRAAERLAERDDIQLVVVGTGPHRHRMEAEIDRLGVDNLLLLPPQPREDFPNVLASADVLLVTLRGELTENPNGYFRAVVPHKLLSGMASGRPILVSAEEEGDTAELVRLSECGLVVPPEDPEALAEAIVKMKQNPEALERWGNNGRDCVCRHFSSSRQVERIEELFRCVIEGETPSLNDPWAPNASEIIADA